MQNFFRAMGDYKNGLLITVVALIFLEMVMVGGFVQSPPFIRDGLSLYKITIDRNQLPITPQESQDVPDFIAISYWTACSNTRGTVRCGQKSRGLIHDTESLGRLIVGNRNVTVPPDSMNNFQVVAFKNMLLHSLIAIFVSLGTGVFSAKTSNFISTIITTLLAFISLLGLGIGIEIYFVRIAQVKDLLASVTPGTSVVPGPGLILLLISGIAQLFAVASFAHATVVIGRRRKEIKRNKLGPLSL